MKVADLLFSQADEQQRQQSVATSQKADYLLKVVQKITAERDAIGYGFDRSFFISFIDT